MIRSDELKQRTNVTSWDIAYVTFGNADADLEIPHRLTSVDPDLIDYQVLSASGPTGAVYHDTSANRKKWEPGLIRLRSAVAGLRAKILLTISEESEQQKLEGGSKEFSRIILPSSIAYEDEANTFTQDQRLEKATPPAWVFSMSGGVIKNRIYHHSDQSISLLNNLSFASGTNFNLDDTSNAGVRLLLHPSVPLRLDYASAGVNPRTPAEILKVSTTGQVYERGRGLAIGEWTSYTPTWSSSANPQPSLGNGTLSGRYMRIGKTVFFAVSFIYGSTSTPGAGAWLFSLPFNAATTAFGAIPARIVDSGTQWYVAMGYIASATTMAVLQDGNTGSGIGPGVPFVWAGGDAVYIFGHYEEA